MVAEFLPFLRGDWTPSAIGIWCIIAMFTLKFASEIRENRKLSSSDRQARREGFEKTVRLLTEENRLLQKDLSGLRAEYDNYRALCQSENDSLRKQVIDVEYEAAGLKRKLADQSRQIANLMGLEVPPVPLPPQG